MVKDSILVKVGDVVKPGTPLATEGATGNVTGRHLHLECYDGNYVDPYYTNGMTIDPVPVLTSHGVSV